MWWWNPKLSNLEVRFFVQKLHFSINAASRGKAARRYWGVGGRGAVKELNSSVDVFPGNMNVCTRGVVAGEAARTHFKLQYQRIQTTTTVPYPGERFINKRKEKSV
jgi:hypothetical protein